MKKAISMEELEQDFPLAFSQMLKLFPNLPHDIVQMYVKRYSNDTDKCSQMLNLLCKDMKTPPLTNKSVLYAENTELPLLLSPIKIPYKFSDKDSTEPVPFLNSTTSDVINQNIDDNKYVVQTQQPSSNGGDSRIVNGPILLDNSTDSDNSKNLNRPVTFQEPLELHINVDEDNDTLHSWRPNLSSSICPDFFMPSPTVENFQTHKNHMSNLAFEHNASQIHLNPEGLQQESEQKELLGGIFYGYLPQNVNSYIIDYENHLHFQKSQMNAIKYEVIKAKIEMNEVQESVEKLNFELVENNTAAGIQDIEKLNEEIVQLRLECQCLCTEVDYYTRDNVPLGEVDEDCYSNDKESALDKPDPAGKHREHSTSVNNNDTTEEVQLWQCHKCTFENHPAINDCEMCQSSRSSFTRKPPYLRTPPDDCYCHPKKETLPVLS